MTYLNGASKDLCESLCTTLLVIGGILVSESRLCRLDNCAFWRTAIFKIVFRH